MPRDTSGRFAAKPKPKDDIPEGYKRCRSPFCVNGLVLTEEIHPSGYCEGCCLANGELNCEACWDEEE